MRFFSACLPAIVLFLVSSLGVAQIPPPTVLAGIAHVAIRVSDLKRSRDFYQKLGFEQAFVLSKDEAVTEAFFKVNDRQFIEVYPQQPGQEIGFTHLCFESSDLEALNRAYLARSLKPTPVRQAGAGNLLFTMAGPEGQNIEFTQYMPGSLHAKDKGRHLGANRISTEIFGVGLRMEDPVAARAFYEQMLGFHESGNALEPGLIPLLLPGSSGQVVLITPNPDEILFSVTSLRHAAAQLNTLHIAFQKQTSTLTIQDPDGTRIVFTTGKPDTMWHLPSLSVPWKTR